MSPKQPTGAPQPPPEEPVENWCEDSDKFGAKVGTKDGFWGWAFETLFCEERDITFKNQVDRVAQVVAHLAMPPIIMAWREAGEDEVELTRLQTHFIADWGYKETTLCAYVSRLRQQASISMAQCVMEFRAIFPIMRGDIGKKDLARNLCNLFNVVIDPGVGLPLAYEKLNEFIRVLEKEDDAGIRDLLVHDHTNLANRLETLAKNTALFVEKRASKIEADVEQRQNGFAGELIALKTEVARQFMEQQATFSKEIAGTTKIWADKMTRLKRTILVFGGALAVSVLVIAIMLLLKLT